MTAVEAVIVSGGLGTRLAPLTRSRPKHLLPVAGVPLVAHQLAKLAAAGIDRVVLATSYRADMFRPVLGDGQQWGIDLVFVTEPEPLGTGGAIRNAARELESTAPEPVVVLNGDILSGHDLRDQIDSHQGAGAEVSLHLVEVPDARAFGCVPTDDAGRVTAFLEKSERPVSPQVNAGCYVFRREVINRIPAGEVVSVERQTFPALVAAGGLVLGYLDDAYWIDVGTPLALCRASADLVLGLAASPAYLQAPAQSWCADSASIDPSATVVEGSSIGPRGAVAGRAEVRGSVVLPDAVVATAAVVASSVIGAGATIGSHAVLRECVVADGVRVPAGLTPPPGSRL
jgi:mannose-1-phosphate guanylyltransferase